MYWILFVMGALVSLVLAVIVGGFATPRKHVAARSVTVRAAPETVWALVRNVGSYAEWRPEIQSSLVDGEEWQEFTPRRTLRFGVAESEAPRRFVARILDDDLPFTGEWTWECTPHADGTRVTLTERGDIGNPISRFVAAHMTGYTSSIDAALGALAIKVGDAAAKIDDARPDAGHA